MKKFFRRLLKIIAWTLGILLVAGTVGYLVVDKKLPEGVEGPEAEALADKMLAAVNKPAWDSLGVLEFTYFKGGHHILWDKTRNLVQVEWSDNRALVDPSNMKGIAWEDGERLTGEKETKVVEKGITWFWNDSFWLMAPFKARDPGTIRKVVTNDDGTRSLLVTYGGGGRTPGDSYLWHLDASGLPIAWQFWVKVLPIGGVRLGWGDWQTMPGGAKLSLLRSSGIADLHFKDVKGGAKLSDLGYTTDVFEPLLAQ
ncbi:MAG TPA: hypothetical protein VHS96_06430 [Bacteroidia bacterium]|nr:hypothetical protein [Bacteroidia bacterium]